MFRMQSATAVIKKNIKCIQHTQNFIRQTFVQDTSSEYVKLFKPAAQKSVETALSGSFVIYHNKMKNCWKIASANLLTWC